MRAEVKDTLDTIAEAVSNKGHYSLVEMLDEKLYHEVVAVLRKNHTYNLTKRKYGVLVEDKFVIKE